MTFSKILTKPSFAKQFNNIFNPIRTFTVSHSKNSFMTVNDCNIYYKKVGNGPQTLLCLPGILGFTEADFGPLMKAMDPTLYTVISWDPPGYGQSRPPNRNFCTDFYSRDAVFAAKLMQKLEVESYSVLGWSNGGITGVHLAANNPEVVEKLVIWGAHAFSDERNMHFVQMMNNIENWSEKMLKPMVDMYGMEYFKILLSGWAKAAEEYNDDPNCNANYFKDQKKVSCPTLIIHGTSDVITQVDHAETLHQRIADSTLHIIPEARHNLHLKHMDLFLKLVGNFLSAPKQLKQELSL